MGSDTFELKTEHIKLLRAAYIVWSDAESGAPCIDPKRPYGNSSVPEDVAEILGVQPEDEEDGEPILSEAQRWEMWERHTGTHRALQVILSAGSFEPGLYARDERGQWHFVPGAQVLRAGVEQLWTSLNGTT